jgi:hypothetical protein
VTKIEEAMNTTIDISQLVQLAWDLEDGGIAGQELAVRRVVWAAQAARVSPTLVGVLADPAEPEIARLRAFGRIATALAETARRASEGLQAAPTDGFADDADVLMAATAV